MGCMQCRDAPINTAAAAITGNPSRHIKADASISQLKIIPEVITVLCDELKLLQNYALKRNLIVSPLRPNGSKNENEVEMLDSFSPKHLFVSRMRREALTQYYFIHDNAIGIGSSGPVRLATHKTTQIVYAVKSLRRSDVSPASDISLCKEVLIYLNLDHPNIAKLCEVFIEDSFVHLVMEYCKGRSLLHRLKLKGCYTEDECRDVTYAMLSAIRYCHEQRICHRDLKLENWVYSDIYQYSPIKLIDFGVSTVFVPGHPLAVMSGTVDYISPEMLDGSYTESCDMWSIGVVVYMLLSGTSPFKGRNNTETLVNIKRKADHFNGNVWKTLSPEALDFVKHLLEKNPQKRLAAVDAMLHPWFHTVHLKINPEIDMVIFENLMQFATSSAVKKATLGIFALLSISSPEVIYLAEQFRKIDFENHGEISITAMAKLLSDKMKLSNEDALSVCRQIDLQEDSVINYWEFLAANLQLQLTNETFFKVAFNRFDSGNKGHISLQDFRDVLGNSYGGLLVEEIFYASDLKRNGVIEFDEFLLAFQNSPDLSI